VEFIFSKDFILFLFNNLMKNRDIWGFYFNLGIFVGKNPKSPGIGIPNHTRVCLEVNTHTGKLDYFINDKHFKDPFVNVPKDVYFGVWYFICYLFLFFLGLFIYYFS
jgi:hypothetical protein